MKSVQEQPTKQPGRSTGGCVAGCSTFGTSPDGNLNDRSIGVSPSSWRPDEGHMQKSTEHLLSLDLCRGFAAICVLFYHSSFLFSGFLTIFPRGYLCVDFFFILSGYVISKSYDGKIAHGMGFREFFVRRIARLWPLVVLTTILGFLVQYARFRRDLPDLSHWGLLISLAANLLMMPSPKSPNEILFPFNPAAWSIYFEMAVNAIYVLAFRYINGAILKATILCSVFALAWTALAFNTLDVGMAQDNFIFGFPRVLFSFFLGIALYRRRRDFGRWAASGALPTLVGLAAVAVFISIPKISLSSLNGLLDLFVIVAVFPLLLCHAAVANFSLRLNSVAWFLGGISYSVYLLQTPLMVGYSALPQLLLGQKVASLAPWAGGLFLLVLSVICYACWRYFEIPAQRRLVRILLKDQFGSQTVLPSEGSSDHRRPSIS